MAYSTPKTWVAGDVLTAAQLNAHIRDQLLAMFPLGAPDVAWTGYTPTLVQPGAITKTVTYGKYTRVGRLIVAAFDLSVTGTGTAGNTVTVGLPVQAAAASGLHVGAMMIYDASTTTRYNGNAELSGAPALAVALSYNQASPNYWGGTPSIALAAGDLLRGTLIYEAAT